MNNYTSINKKAVEYRNAYNLDKFVECFHEKVEFITLDDNKTVATGRNELMDLIKNNPQSKTTRWEISEMTPVNNKLFTHETSITERNEKEEYIFIYEYENDLIRKVWYTNK